MQKVVKSDNNGSSVIVDDDIRGVQLGFVESTSRARVFNIALKLASLQWTDKVIDQVEKIVDDRIREIAGSN